MRGITPHLWFDTAAAAAAEFYCETFPDSRVTATTALPDTPSGDARTVAFELFGQPFMAISAGPLCAFNPSISFTVACETPEEVDRYWQRLAPGGSVLMELGQYPCSERYGWVADRFGVSWQISQADDAGQGQRITPSLLFVGDAAGRARDAIELYTSVFPEAEQCGWLKDRFGVSWQLAPADLHRMLSEGSDEQVARVTEAFLQMQRFDLAQLQRVYDGAAAGA